MEGWQLFAHHTETILSQYIYVFSKVWFKCCSVNLRNQDINFINSQVKGWLYQYQLEKPSETVLFRGISDGGISLYYTILNPYTGAVYFCLYKCSSHLMIFLISLPLLNSIQAAYHPTIYTIVTMATCYWPRCL